MLRKNAWKKGIAMLAALVLFMGICTGCVGGSRGNNRTNATERSATAPAGPPPRQTGPQKCGYCKGMGICPVCYGNSCTYVPDYTGTGGTYVYCEGCHGDNKCPWCHGTGVE